MQTNSRRQAVRVLCPGARSLAHLAYRKGPTQTQKWKTLQKLILSYFYNVVHLISQLSDTEMLRMAVSESSKLLPYVMSSRKAVKVYLKVSQTSVNRQPAGTDCPVHPFILYRHA